jgi:flagellar motor switch protein FliN
MTTSPSTPSLHAVSSQAAASHTVRAIDLADLAADPHEERFEQASALLKDAHPLHQIKTKVQVRVGEAELTVGELIEAKEGQVLRLNRPIHEAVELLIEGRVIARGHLVALDGRFAIRISEVPQSLRLPNRP